MDSVVRERPTTSSPVVDNRSLTTSFFPHSSMARRRRRSELLDVSYLNRSPDGCQQVALAARDRAIMRKDVRCRQVQVQ